MEHGFNAKMFATVTVTDGYLLWRDNTKLPLMLPSAVSLVTKLGKLVWSSIFAINTQTWDVNPLN